MKSLYQYIIEKAHIANNKEIDTIADEITDFCINQYDDNEGDCEYEFSKYGFFGKHLKKIRVRFGNYRGVTAKIQIKLPSIDDLLNVDDILDQDVSEIGKAKYELHINKSYMKELLGRVEDHKGEDRFYSIITHELTHLYEILNGLQQKSTSVGDKTPDAYLEYFFTKTEIDARINQTYHLVKRKYSRDLKRVLELLDDFEISDSEFIHDLVRDYSDIAQATRLPEIDSKMKQSKNPNKYKKAYKQYVKKLYRVVYDAFNELKQEQG